MRVFLIGFMGVGKTTVGRRLAEQLGFTFVDLDAEVEKAAGATVPEVFAREGEHGFRDREHLALRAACAGSNVVVATGGGAATFERNTRLMQETGVTIWLDLPFEVLHDRLKRDPAGRPLFAASATMQKLFDARREAYRRADHHLELAAEATPELVAERIVQLLGGPACVT